MDRVDSGAVHGKRAARTLTHLASNSWTTANSCPCKSTHEIVLAFSKSRWGLSLGLEGFKIDFRGPTRRAMCGASIGSSLPGWEPCADSLAASPLGSGILSA